MAFAYDFQAVLAAAAAVSIAPRPVSRNSLTPPRPFLTESTARFSSLDKGEQMRREATTIEPTVSNGAVLESAFLLLVERVAGTVYRLGPATCAAFVGEVDGHIADDAPALAAIRRALPEFGQAERQALRLLRTRCATCVVSNCDRSGE